MMKEKKTDQKSVKKALIKSSNAIKRKYRELHRERLILGEKVREKYEPIINPLNQLVSNNKKITQNKNNESLNITQQDGKDDDDFETEIAPEHNINSITEGNSNHTSSSSSSSSSTNDLEEHLEQVNQKSPLYDATYGIRKYRQSYMIGKNVVKFDSGNLYVKKQSFTLTNGLKNLLFLKEPSGFSESDLQAYKDILNLTKISGKYSLKRANQTSKDSKFVKIIQPLYIDGSGIQLDFMRENRKKKIEYTYWDDPNELVERLMLLISSQQAGHTGHDNEIISIIEELREADIIE